MPTAVGAPANDPSGIAEVFNMCSKELAIVMILSLVFFIPGVYGICVSVNGGDGGSHGSILFDLSADNDASVNANIVANGASLKPMICIHGTASLNENHQVTDSSGNHAEVHAKVITGKDITYSDSITPAEGNLGYSTGSVEADQSLNVGYANHIICGQSASNAAGDKASDGIELYGGSLTNYAGSAYAESDEAYVDQAFDNAAGKSIDVEEQASTDVGKATESTEITNGAISGYTPFILPTLAEHGVGVAATRAFSGATGKNIELNSFAFTPDGYKASETIDVAGKYAQNGIVNEDIGLSAVNEFIEGPAAVDLINTISGDKIDIDSSASDRAGNKASVSTEVKGGTIADGEFGAYVDTTADDINAIQSASGVTGNELSLKAKATPATGHAVQKNTDVSKPTSIAYHNNAEVSSGTPTVDQGIP